MVHKAAYSENYLSRMILNASIKVHRNLGPGLLESAYQRCLLYELRNKKLKVEFEKPLPLVYEDVHLDAGYRIDLMVNKKVIIEIKSVKNLNDIHMAQLLTYLKLSNCKLGLLINFNRLLLKDGFKRVVNGL